jgi:hypothetical protein
MIALLPIVLLMPPTSEAPSELAQFRAAYAARRSDIPTQQPDPAIGQALDILIGVVRRGLQEHPEATDQQVQSWVRPFARALAPRDEDQSPVDEYHAVIAGAVSGNGVRFIMAGMGAVTRTVCYDSHWRPIALPKEYGWNTPWNPLPKPLPCGLWLMDSDSIQAAGIRVRLRLVWLKLNGRRGTKVGQFEAAVVLDYAQAQIKGNRVTAHTVDNPHTFFVCADDPTFERFTTWDCSSGKPRLVRVELKQQTLRAVDQAIYASWRAKHPTRLQQRIRKLWPSQDMLDEWTEKRLANGLIRVTLTDNNSVSFDLVSTGSRCRVVAVHEAVR